MGAKHTYIDHRHRKIGNLRKEDCDHIVKLEISAPSDDSKNLPPGNQYQFRAE